ncbi:MAG TPA: RluA family pseudouridine synthase [Kofleriaceae bacterium]
MTADAGDVTYFEPPVGALPVVMASPFAPGEPHPLARRAADALIRWIRDQPALDARLQAPGGGKMFGVLVVAAPDGRVGFLRGFSGMLDGQWRVAGFAPPLYDEAARDAIWPAGQRQLRDLELGLRAHDASPAHLALRHEHAAMVARHAAALAELQARHRAARATRHAARAALGADAAVQPGADPAALGAAAQPGADLAALGADAAAQPGADPAALGAAARHALDQASRADAAERRALDAAHAAERARLDPLLAALDAERAGLEHQRGDESRALMKQVHDSYRITSARGERRDLRALFAPGEPPGGAGDCAAPKLLGHAYRLGLRPVALAELWWGAPPATGGRHTGQFYPACRGKCGPILPFMLEGLAHAEAPIFGADAAVGEPRTVFEDAWLLVVDKPHGLLSVPGRSGALADSVLTRLRARLPAASVVHRLDLDTSGLLILAKDLATHAALQRAFSERAVTKRYVAWLAGTPAAERGTVSLPLRVDLDDRPRQIVDPVHGKPAITDWHVLARASGRTRVALFPRTGRTHQLRVHAAHPAGLGAPIAGDRLYGTAAPEPRLLLHAEALAFTHPHTGHPVELIAPAPF